MKFNFNINPNLLQISSIVVLISFYGFGSHIPQALRYDLYYVIPWGFVIFSFAFEKGFLAKKLSSNMLVFLGEISFSFYMFHLIVIIFGSVIFKRLLHIENNDLYIALSFLSLSIAASSLSFLFFERQSRKWLVLKLMKPVSNVTQLINSMSFNQRKIIGSLHR